MRSKKKINLTGKNNCEYGTDGKVYCTENGGSSYSMQIVLGNKGFPVNNSNIDEPIQEKMDG